VKLVSNYLNVLSSIRGSTSAIIMILSDFKTKYFQFLKDVTLVAGKLEFPSAKTLPILSHIR
jgi:hypothetical protein